MDIEVLAGSLHLASVRGSPNLLTIQPRPRFWGKQYIVFTWGKKGKKMNHVQLTGRLTKDPECKKTAGNTLSVARFTLAVRRPKTKEGDPEADFLPIVCFGKLAENIAQYVHKGRLVAVSGRIQIGSYEKEGKKIYTTDIIANSIEFLSANPGQKTLPQSEQTEKAQAPSPEEALPPEELTTLSSEETPF